MENEDMTGPVRVRDQPTWRIAQVHARAHRIVNARLRAQGFTGRQYRLLAALVESEASSQADLGRLAGLDRSDVVAGLDALVEHALAVREADPRDRRRNVVTATGEGVETLVRLDAAVAGAQDELLARLSEQDRAQLDRLLTLLLAPPAESG
jgi:DNA-binding MarR family transcriptional regulator